ncbi:hypothetical protein [Streptomyces sp. NRRL F-4428]|uniref:hypothetical protein n=1 Tax=Streptomyces sp. NRRL F-4428 TaxID=1609137 RepID=UPI0005ECB60E|nr:hypothetical protein [Streptomyces sp. NRRL F-4428]KJK47968.1 hypothetical protein UK14_19480 [Streptomyces sp. NRRL F-4428]
MAHRGDRTGDAKEDIVTRVGGELRVYRVVGVGDVTKDGHPDLLVQHSNKLYLYASIAMRRAAVGTRS